MAINDGVELVASWLTPTVLFCVMNVMIGTIFFRSSLRPRTKQQRKDDQPPHSPRQLGPNPSFFQRVRSFNMNNYEAMQPDPVHHPAHSEQPRHLASNPSFFQRLKSFNMSSHQTRQPDPLHHAEPADYRREEIHHAVPAHEPADYRREEIHHTVPAHEPADYRREEIHHAEPAHEPADYRREEIHSAVSAEETEARQEEEIYHAAPAEEPAARRIHCAAEEPRQHVRTRSDALVKAAPAAKVLLKSVSELRLTEEEEEERWRPATARERAVTEQEEEEVDGKADDFINKFRQQLKLQRLDSLVRYNDMLNRGAGRWR